MLNYIVAKINDEPVLFRVYAKDLYEAELKLNDYCRKKSINCKILYSFSDGVYEVPHVMFRIICSNGIKIKFVEVTDIDECKNTIEEMTKEYSNCSITMRLVCISRIEMAIASYYYYDMNYDLDHAVFKAKYVASQPVEVR